jgi:hypothetical protein
MSLSPCPSLTCEPWPVPPGCSWPPAQPTSWPGTPEDWEQLTGDLWTSAAETVWALTGRRLGVCLVRAAWGLTAQRTCLPEPWLYEGRWYNAWPSATPCCEVRLDSPLGAVLDVVEVFVDGEALPESAWVLDGPERLLTADASCWPVGTWCEPRRMVVTWLAGQSPPTLALLATGELAGELVAPCVGGTCRLPSNVTSVTRQGVTVTLGDPAALLAEGLTGLPMLDLAIRTFNPARLPMRSRVFSPDVPRPEYRSVG